MLVFLEKFATCSKKQLTIAQVLERGNLYHLTTPDPEFECMCISVGLIDILLYRNQEYSIGKIWYWWNPTMS